MMEFSRRVKDRRPQTENRRHTAGGVGKTRKNILKPPEVLGKVKPKATMPSVTIRGQRTRENAVPTLRTGEPSILCTELNKGADRATCHTPRPAPHTHFIEKPPAWGVETLAPLGGEAAIRRAPQRLPGFPPGKHRTSLSPSPRGGSRE